MCENSLQISHHEAGGCENDATTGAPGICRSVETHSVVILALLLVLEQQGLMPGGKKLVSREFNEEAGKWCLSSIFTH